MSDLTVVPISGGSPNGENVIARLEEALELAKDGGISNCIVIMACSNGDVMDCWANGNKPFVMIGALESIKREFMDSKIEARQ